MKDTLIAIKAFLASLFRTFRPDDLSVVGWTALATAAAKICTGILIPFIALAVAIYQLRIQRRRFQREDLLLTEAQSHNQTDEKEA